MKYKTIIFDEGLVDVQLTNYLNKYRIPKENIVSISFSHDVNALNRFKHYSVNQILLVYLEKE